MPELGLSIRFMQHYDSTSGDDLIDRALLLACFDQRAVPFNVKIADAIAFLRQREANHA